MSNRTEYNSRNLIEIVSTTPQNKKRNVVITEEQTQTLYLLDTHQIITSHHDGSQKDNKSFGEEEFNQKLLFAISRFFPPEQRKEVYQGIYNGEHYRSEKLIFESNVVLESKG